MCPLKEITRVFVKMASQRWRQREVRGLEFSKDEESRGYENPKEALYQQKEPTWAKAKELPGKRQVTSRPSHGPKAIVLSSLSFLTFV